MSINTDGGLYNVKNMLSIVNYFFMKLFRRDVLGLFGLQIVLAVNSLVVMR